MTLVALGIATAASYLALSGAVLLITGGLVIGIGAALLFMALSGQFDRPVRLDQVSRSDPSGHPSPATGGRWFTTPSGLTTRIAVLIVVLIFISPLVPMGVAWYHGVDWRLAADIGQSYGAVSAILAGLALLGVIGSIAIQTRQTKIQAQFAARQMHFEIMREAWQNPDLLKTLGDFERGERKKIRQHIFINIHLMYMRMGVLSGEFSMAELEEVATEIFGTAPGRRYWKHAEKYLVTHFEKDYVDALTRASKRAGQAYHIAGPRVDNRATITYTAIGSTVSLALGYSLARWLRSGRN